MKSIDALLLGFVSVVWGVLALMYATIPVIRMPMSFRVWGLGAILFLALTVVAALADRRARRRR